MSEFSSLSVKKLGLPSFDLLSELIKIFFFVLSHPLYFSYFVFFSPYLYKLFSFLSPLFITTTLLILAFLTTLSPSLVHDHDHEADSSGANPSFLSFTCQKFLERLRSEKDGDEGEELLQFEEFEVYKIVFDTSSSLEISEYSSDVLEEVVKETCSEDSQVAVVEALDKCQIIHESNDFELPSSKDGQNGNFEKTPDEVFPTKVEQQLVGMESLKWCLDEEEEEEEEEKKELENRSCKTEDTVTKVKPWIVELDKVDSKASKEELFTRSGSKAKRGHKINEVPKVQSGDTYFASPEWDFDGKHSIKSSNMNDSPTQGPNLGSFGSTRKEREWRRTLACKLFEERHNANGTEGMDLLWETYENESSNSQDNKTLRKNSTKKGKKGVTECSDAGDYDEDYEDETNGQLCCLQALKFSAGKMNLGMARPNLVKFSKALKGIGWLHNMTRHGKKRHNTD